jgi:hypothetical protein
MGILFIITQMRLEKEMKQGGNGDLLFGRGIDQIDKI